MMPSAAKSLKMHRVVSSACTPLASYELIDEWRLMAIMLTFVVDVETWRRWQMVLA